MNKQNGIDSQLAYVKSSANNRYDIFLYDFNSNTSTNLTISNQSVIGNFDPRWSPNGQHIAWSATPNEGWPRQLWIMDTDGQNAYLTNAEGDIEISRWSPDGSKIAYINPYKINIYDIKTDTTTPLKSANMAVNDFSANDFLWSPDSQSIAFQTVVDDFYCLAIADIENETVQLVRKDMFDEVVWPQQDTIYFSGSPMQVNGKIFDSISRLSLDGQVTNLMPLDALQHSILTISPDGQQIAYFTFIGIPINELVNHPDGKGSLHVVDSDGQNHQEILHEAIPGRIRWSHNQTKLAWGTNMTRRIYTVDLVSRETRLIGERCGDVAWRP